MADINFQYKGLMTFALIIFFIILIFIGLYFKNKNRSLTDYVLAGRNLPLFVVISTIISIWICAGPLIGGASNAYLFGLQGVISDPFSAALCLVLMSIFFAKTLRGKNFRTICDIFFARYGNAAGLISCIIMIFIEIGWVGSQLVAMSAILKIIINIPYMYSLIICCIIVSIYIYLGGMRAIAASSVVFFFFIIVGILLLFPYIIQLLGGFEIYKSAKLSAFDIPFWNLLPTKREGYLGYTGINGWVYYIGAWFSIGLGSLCAQDLALPLLSSKSEKHAAKAALFSAPIYLLIGIIGPLLGIAFYVYMPGISIAETENIIPFLGTLITNPILSILFFLAIFSILISTCAGAAFSASTIIGCSLFPAIKPDLDEYSQFIITKISIPATIFTALFLALKVTAVYRIMVISWTILLVGLMASFIAAFFWKKANHIGAVISILVGIFSWVVLITLYLPLTVKNNTDIVEGTHIYWEWAIWDAVYISSTWAFLISIITLIIVSLITQKFDQSNMDNIKKD